MEVNVADGTTAESLFMQVWPSPRERKRCEPVRSTLQYGTTLESGFMQVWPSERGDAILVWAVVSQGSQSNLTISPKSQPLPPPPHQQKGMLGASEYNYNLGHNYSHVLTNKFQLNQKYVRGWWINPGYSPSILTPFCFNSIHVPHCVSC